RGHAGDGRADGDGSAGSAVIEGCDLCVGQGAAPDRHLVNLPVDGKALGAVAPADQERANGVEDGIARRDRSDARPVEEEIKMLSRPAREEVVPNPRGNVKYWRFDIQSRLW